MKSVDDNKIGEPGGFTLLEILLAMVITSVLILGINASYHQAHRVWSSVESRRPVYQRARLITENLRQELSCLYFPPSTEEQEHPFRLVHLPDEGTELVFYTLGPSWKGSPESSLMTKVRYKFESDPDSEEASLVRHEQLCAGEKIIGPESSEIIARDMSEFRIWVFDPNSGAGQASWQESFESKDNPPKGLKFSLKWPETAETSEIDFQYSMLIPCESPTFE
jgi:prepilin-type N-terminal cleavage/methylation domain-containing protein